MFNSNEAILGELTRKHIGGTPELYRSWQQEMVPYVRLRKEPTKRVRFLWEEEANRLFRCFPPHLVPVVAFALATGARASEILQLEWDRVDLQRRVAWLTCGNEK